MNAIRGAGFVSGFPANAVLKLSQNGPIQARGVGFAGAEVILEAVKNPPRIGETRPIAALLPEVLSMYGLGQSEKLDAAMTINSVV